MSEKHKKRTVSAAWIRLAACVLSVFLAWSSFGGAALAAEKQPYTYTVTLYAGNQGSFPASVPETDPDPVTVDNHMTGSDYRITKEADRIVVSGLQRGDVVAFDVASEGAVQLKDGSRYYVKGVRLSGRDNNTVAAQAFPVNGDADYVVAYGIRGTMTSYTVNYRDGSGNTLSPSRTYYGNVGDKPVVAFLYINGYQPRAYNLTKTLSANEAENVFTFVYSKVVIPVLPAESQPSQEGGASQAPTEGSGTGSGTGTGTGTGTGGNAGGTTGEGTGENTGDNTGGNTGDNTGETTGETEETTAPEESEPETPSQIEDLDEPDVPRGDFTADPDAKADADVWLTYGAAAIAVIAIIAVILLFVWLLRRPKKKDAGADEKKNDTPDGGSR